MPDIMLIDRFGKVVAVVNTNTSYYPNYWNMAEFKPIVKIATNHRELVKIRSFRLTDVCTPKLRIYEEEP